MNPCLSILICIVLLAVYIRAEFDTSNSVPSIATRARDATPYRFVAPGRTAGALPSSAAGDIDIVDIVILASVDGKLHALNRTTGLTLWSMGDDPDSNQSPPTTFDSLVRTQHSAHEDSDQELFIIEPQSGDIYVLPSTASPSDPLDRLPFSVPQLVEMSPFSFPGDEHRMFVGSKETSMVVIELDTGRVKGTVNSDKECFWDDEVGIPDDIDLDELNGSKPPRRKLQSREIHIGRTDYHVRVHTRHQGVVQNLRFSSYGPNNVDREKQSLWKRTPDDLYIQPLSNGQILAFRVDGVEDAQHVSNDGMPIWGRDFRIPIVAVFDVIMTHARINPLALLQPRPHLEQLFPLQTTKNRHIHNLPEATYVGLVGDSFYAMSHDNFPLVVFDPKPPRSLNEATKEGCAGRQCLVGSRRSQTSSQWYIPPLLDSAPHLPSLQERVSFEGSSATIPDSETNDSQAEPSTQPEAYKYVDASFGMWGAFGGAFLVLVLLARTFFVKRRTHVPATPEFSSKESVANPADASPSLSDSSSVIPLPPAEKHPVVAEEVSASPDPIDSPTPRHEVSLPNLKPPSQLPTSPTDTPGDVEEGDDSEKEGPSDLPRRKGPRRRKRGKKKKNENQAVEADEEYIVLPPLKEDVAVSNPPVPVPTTPVPIPNTPVPVPPLSSLVVSDTVLGFGSHGTVVYEGSLQGRAVAVKRLLQDFVTIAAREVELLQESDDHPNVIRYFYKESKDGFLYIALELCPASLADVVERPDSFASISAAFDPKRALAQITDGLRHLHTLKIVHRDIKPQNILVSRPKAGQHRMLISDFGLCKKLEVDQTSFLPTAAAGTAGWRAPEILRGEVKLDEQPMDPDDRSSKGSTGSWGSGRSNGQPTRLTKSVDVFALGCLFYYTLTGGWHPYGDRFEREGNIMKGRMNLTGLEQFGEEGVEAAHLISQMLDQDAKARPDTTACLIHPFFWTPARRLNFLQDASDRFEIMCREPREPPLITLETGAFDVVGNDWHNRLDRVFIENLGKFRKYDGRSVQDLLRALRNKKHHYQDMPDHVKRHLGPLPDGFLGYFTRRFPGLILHVHDVVWRCGLGRESMFQSYFELAET